jgi:hypothetical protein
LELKGFGLHCLPAGTASVELKRVLVPVYLWHRYAVDAAAKMIGGVDFSYALAGDGHEVAHAVSGADQRRALKSILAAVDPAVLDLPDSILTLLESSFPIQELAQYSAEVFGDADDPVFDLPNAAERAADLVFSDLLQPARLDRLADQSARDPAALGLREMLDAMMHAAFGGAGAPHAAEIRRHVQARLIIDLVKAATDTHVSLPAQAELWAALRRVGEMLAGVRTGRDADVAQAAYFAGLLKESGLTQLRALAAADKAADVEAPPGMPIGEAGVE